ncbi:unnamed protein product [Pneumocystis jirovecii]|uniref:Association with the SNF1 complex (ASC) domain-containing protein n=1 Tax=Pneumocystis jirovecii TaxID=42068 RepID=L0P6Q5_PNEJI|nr:unnamed protein product [Pneumocystis jirovecii]
MGNTYSQENLRYDKDPIPQSSGHKSDISGENGSKLDANSQKIQHSDAEDDSSSVNSETEREQLDIHSLEDINKIGFENNQPYSFSDYSCDKYDIKDHDIKNHSTISSNYENIALDIKQDKVENTVPVFLRWKGDNKNVYVTGTFTDWGKKIPLNKSTNDFTVLINLSKGTHKFKFYVDNEWKCSDELATATDSSGNLFNYIEVSETCLSSVLQNDKQSSLTEHRVNKPPETYTNEIPAFLHAALENNAHCMFPESYIPPSLPPHLEKVILNSNSTMKDDQSVLPNPNHVVLNHLAACSIRNGVLAVSVTTRFRSKTNYRINFFESVHDKIVLCLMNILIL